MLLAYTSNPDSTKKYLEPNPQRRLSLLLIILSEAEKYSYIKFFNKIFFLSHVSAAFEF